MAHEMPSELASAPSVIHDAGAIAAGTAELVRDPERTAAYRPAIVQAVSEVFDPEIPVNIYELGLIYDIVVDPSSVVTIRMTLTAPACPSAETIPAEVRRRVAAIDGVRDVKIDLVWEPPWSRDCMSDAARLQLGLD